MASSIHVEVVGDTVGVHHALRHLEAKLESPAMMAFMQTVIYPFITQRAVARFRNEGDEVSGKWAPLARATVNFRQSMGFPGEHPINRRTGELERYITGSPAAILPIGGGVMMKYPPQAATGSLGEKVMTAQKGKGRPSTRPRPVLALGIADLSFTLTSLATYIEA